MIGLPYWGWEELEVNGEVMPRMIREMCDEIDDETWAKMQAEDPTALDFYPGSWEDRDGHYWLGYRTTRSGEFVRVPDDSALKRLIESADVVEQAERSLHMSMHRTHASSTYASGRAQVERAFQSCAQNELPRRAPVHCGLLCCADFDRAATWDSARTHGRRDEESPLELPPHLLDAPLQHRPLLSKLLGGRRLCELPP